MKEQNDMVTSVFGEISRRELLRYLGAAGLAFGLGGRDLFATPPDELAAPPVKLGGTPFRDITTFQTFIDDKYDLKTFQKAGIPKPRSRDTSWLDKPSNALGVSLLQFTNPSSISLNSCSQAATACIPSSGNAVRSWSKNTRWVQLTSSWHSAQRSPCCPPWTSSSRWQATQAVSSFCWSTGPTWHLSQLALR